ncbi:MAG: 1-acyl-sn-glycerol-3-phosphate acyltransferase [Candidatus Melainabacteria bacterium]|nr:1-acyl-sn-glycerol-3-phosphate acyltransferase [Candidatus Melainabacteria bacterium]
MPAKPAPWLITAAQQFVRAELAFSNRIFLDSADLEMFRKIPKGAGISLTSNHADETDPRVVVELSRRSGKRFISMCNREAFDENNGLAGWALQRLGHFSVERGAHDTPAKVFAIDVIKSGSEVLVIFPEGEIFYMNEVVQPFHSGAIDLTMQAIIDKRRTDPKWTAFIVPMAIKYHYEPSVISILQTRIAKIESHLSMTVGQKSLPERLLAIQKVLIDREEQIHRVALEKTSDDLEEEIMLARRKILSDVERKYHGDEPLKRRAIDEAWKLGAELREKLEEQSDLQEKAQLEADIATLQEVAQLASWHPNYYAGTTSIDRMAEVVLKMERELYHIKRPPQMASRKVFVKIAEPVDIGAHIEEYQKDAHAVRSQLTDKLQNRIQSLLDDLKNRK